MRLSTSGSIYSCQTRQGSASDSRAKLPRTGPGTTWLSWFGIGVCPVIGRLAHFVLVGISAGAPRAVNWCHSAAVCLRGIGSANGSRTRRLAVQFSASVCKHVYLVSRGGCRAGHRPVTSSLRISRLETPEGKHESPALAVLRGASRRSTAPRVASFMRPAPQQPNART